MRFLCSSKHENLAVLSWILSIGSQTLSDVVRFIHTFRHISTLLPVRSTDRFLSVMSPLTGFTQKQREVSRFSLTLQRLMWHRPSSRGRVTPASRRSEPEVTLGRCCLNTNTPVHSDRHWEQLQSLLLVTEGWEQVCVCVYGPENNRLFKEEMSSNHKQEFRLHTWSINTILRVYCPVLAAEASKSTSYGCCLRSNFITWASVCCRLILTYCKNKQHEMSVILIFSSNSQRKRD